MFYSIVNLFNVNHFRNILQLFSFVSISSLICCKKNNQNTLSNNILCDSNDSLLNKPITIQIKKVNLPKLSRRTSSTNLLNNIDTQNNSYIDIDEENGLNKISDNDNNLFIEEKTYAMRKLRLSEVDFERRFSLTCDSCRNKIPIHSEVLCLRDKLFCTESCKNCMFPSL